MKNKKKFEILLKGKTAEIWIYEDIGDTWIGGISAKTFADELKKVGKVDTINLYINSQGGSVMDGLAIYNSLKRNKARKVVEIDGFALSIAAVVAMAGDEIRMAKNGAMMIHNPWVVTSGTADELREQADAMDKIGEGLVNTFADRTGLDPLQISEMMDAETWLTATEAQENGFIDEITDEKQMAAWVPEFAMAKFNYNPPEKFLSVNDKKENKTQPTNLAEWKRRLKIV